MKIDGWMDKWIKQPVVTMLFPPLSHYLFPGKCVEAPPGHLKALGYLLTAALEKVPEVPMGDTPSQLLAQTGQQAIGKSPKFTKECKNECVICFIFVPCFLDLHLKLEF